MHFIEINNGVEMARQTRERDNSRYRKTPAPLAEQSYEVNETRIGTLLSVPVHDLKLLGLMPEWNQSAFISGSSWKSARGKYAFLYGNDIDVFREVYEHATGMSMKTHPKGNDYPLHVNRLIPFDAEVERREDLPMPGEIPYSCPAETSTCTSLAVYNPILQSVTDFIMYMVVCYIIDNHQVQGPKMLDTKYLALRTWIRSKTPALSGTFYDDKTRMMWVYQFRTAFPVCPTCHREFGRLRNIHLSKTYSAYQPHCSSYCAKNDPCVQALARATSLEKYGVDHPAKSSEVRRRIERTLLERYGTSKLMEIEGAREKAMATSRSRYGTSYPAQTPDILAKTADTMLQRYGTSIAMRVPEFKDKAKKTMMERYGVDSIMRIPEARRRAMETRFSKMKKENCIKVDGGYLDPSSWEKTVYDICVKHGLRFIYHPASLPFEFNGKTRHYEPDFEIEGRLYECKGDQFIREDGRWQCVYDHSNDDLYEAKRQCAVRNNVRILTAFDMPYVESIILHPELDRTDGQGYSINRAFRLPDVSERKCFGLSIEDVVGMCMKSAFPGTWTWPSDHPIWSCNVRGKIAPIEAWSRPSYLEKAVVNMFNMISKEVYGVRRDMRFVEVHREAFCKAIAGDASDLLVKVLNRFTIARIAPKVTALQPALFRKIVAQSGIDISKGVYCPMAGFGGIVLGAKQWFRKRGLDYRGRIYAADVNPVLCKRYGWTQKDVLSDYVETDMVVAACPPFADTEQWPGTPADCYRDFHEWARLIREHVKAPGYILIGPSDRYVREKDRHGRVLSPMFAHKEQARYYPEYSEGRT